MQCRRCLTSHLDRTYNDHAQKCRCLCNHSTCLQHPCYDVGCYPCVNQKWNLGCPIPQVVYDSDVRFIGITFNECKLKFGTNHITAHSRNLHSTSWKSLFLLIVSQKAYKSGLLYSYFLLNMYKCTYIFDSKSVVKTG